MSDHINNVHERRKIKVSTISHGWHTRLVSFLLALIFSFSGVAAQNGNETPPADAQPAPVEQPAPPPSDTPDTTAPAPAPEPAPEPAPAPVTAPAEGVVAEIDIQGNSNISQDAILSAIELTLGGPFTQAQMQRDRAAIERLGFFSVVSARQEDVPGGKKITFEVIENPRINKIEFSGNTAVTREELLEAIRTKEGQVYNVNTLDQDLRAIEDMYSSKGYLAYVTAEAQIDPITGVLTLPILEFRVGQVRFTGLTKTKDWVLRREMELKPGMIYDANQLQQDITRIYELDYLDIEKAEAPRREPGEEEGYVDIVIPVAEKKTGSVSVGLGYSSAEKVVGRVEVGDSNFRGKGYGVNALVEFSGINGGTSYELGYFDRWFRSDRTSLSARVYNRNIYRFSTSAFGGSTTIQDSEYRERRAGGTIGLSRPIGKRTTGFVNLRIEGVDVNAGDRPNIDVPPASQTPEQIDEYDRWRRISTIGQDASINSVGFRIANDTRDFSLDPATGNYLQFIVEPGFTKFDKLTGFTLDANGNPETPQYESLNKFYTKFEIDARKYISPGGRKVSVKDVRTTFAFRVRAGIITSEVPFAEQFFAGGAERLRGYREDRFFGNQLFLASAEYRQPISGGLSGVIFMDYGDAWGGDYTDAIKEFPESSSFEGHFGYGAGIRVATPIGNLRFDYGFGSEGSRTHFSIGQAF